MSKKLSLALSLTLTLAFILTALIWALGFAPAKGLRISARPVDSAALLSGGDEGNGALELLPGELIDINTADVQQLQKLPGIGEALSAAIVEYRESAGSFESIEDIMKVPGIGEGRFAAIEGNITVGEKAA